MVTVQRIYVRVLCLLCIDFVAQCVTRQGAWCVSGADTIHMFCLCGKHKQAAQACSDLILSVALENKQKRQIALGQTPTQRVKKPDVRRGEKFGWAPAWYGDYQHNAWTKRRTGPAY